MSETATGATGAWSYRTGDWFAVFGVSATVLLPASQKDQVVALWSLVDGGAGFDEVLDGLLASGLSRIPGFVLVSDDDGPTRVLLRGQGVSATLATAAEEVTLDGAASHTWVERSVDGVLALSIGLPTEDDAARGEADFPIATGLVRVGQVDRPAVVPASGGAHAAAPAVDVPGDAVVEADMAPGEAPPLDLAKPAPADDDLLGAPAAEPAEEPVEDALAEDVVVDEPAGEEPDVMAEAATPGPDAMADEDESFPLDDGPATEVMDVVPDPLSDPLPSAPSAPAPDGWVTPWDSSPASAADATGVPDASEESPTPGEPVAPDLLDEPDTPAVPSPPLPPMGGETEVAPVGWVPPPPPSGDAPADAPPLGIGSWEPVGGTTPPPPAPPAPFDPDHDGQTVTGVSPDMPSPPQPGIPGQPPAPAVTQPVAKLLISDGQTVVVDRAVLIGRAPEARRFTSTEQPMLVTVPSRLHEISSTHVEVRPGTGADHGTAVVTDMGSTNGTVLVQPGLGPEDLKPGIAVQLIPGAIINLGDGITIQVTRP